MKIKYILLFFAYGAIINQLFANNTLQQKIDLTDIDTAKVDLLNQAAEQYKTTDIEKALEFAKNALSISLSKKYHNGTANAFYHIADIYKSKSSNNLALEYFNKSIRYFKVVGDNKSLIKVYNKIGVIYFNKYDYNKAIFYYNKALKLAEKLNDYQSHAGILNNIGNIYYTQGKYSEAIDFYGRSLKIREQKNDTDGIAGSLQNLASIYYKQGLMNEAEKMYLKSITMRESVGNKKGVANAYLNLGTLYIDLKNFDKALSYLNKALEIYSEIKDENGMANTYSLSGNVYSELKENKKAIEYFDKALALFKENDDIKGQTNIFLSKGNILVNQGNYTQGIKELEKAKLLSEQYEISENKRIAYFSLAEAYEKLKDYKNAYINTKLYKSLYDSIVDQELTTKLAETQKKYNEEAQLKQIQVLQKEKENQELKIKQNTNRITILLISLIALAIITFLVIISNRIKQKTNQVLTKQNEDILRQKHEKEVLLKEIHHRVKNNLQVINSLLRLQSSMIDDPKVISLFEDCQNRVRSMALIHDKLYTINDLSSIQVKEYIENLTSSLLETYGLKTKVKLQLNIQPISFNVDTLIPLGLLLNEIISNSLKYAFKEKESGTIKVELKALNSNKFELNISDDGAGFSDEIFITPQNSLGIELIKSFVEQLDGTIEKLKHTGTAYRIIFQKIGEVNKSI
jgi:two-component sensor histidine kinase/Tfp pilus assembly protein PilF